MADFQLTVIFGAQKGGWTESWFLDSTNFATAKLAGDAYITARAAMLGAGAFIDAFRITSPSSPGQSDFYPIDPSFTTALAVPSPRDVIQTTIIMRIQSTNGSRRMFEISGLPDGSIVFDNVVGDMVFTSFAATRCRTFANAIIQIPVRMSVITKDSVIVNLKPVQAAVSAGTGQVTITSVAHGYAANDRVRISAVQTAARPYITGVWTVKTPGVDTFVIENAAATVPFVVGQGGKIRRQVRRMEDVVSGRPFHVGNRKRGRAFFQPVGRRPRR